jgi:phenylacetate-CoA ligase
MYKIFELLYHFFPVPIQNIGITLFGLHWYKRRFGGIFKTELKKSIDREYYTHEQWDLYQEEILRRLLIHSFDTVPFYSKQFSEIGLTREDLINFKLPDLKKLSFLDKNTFRLLGETELLSNNLERSGEFYGSSGSTGTPTKTRYSLRMHQEYFAIFESRIHNWAGINYKMSRGVVGGRRIIRDGNSSGPYYRYNYIENQVYFSAYHISKNTAKEYIKGMVKYKIEYLTGYASANYVLARFILEQGLTAPKLKAVLTSSEKLTDEMRDVFRKVYGCESFDSYNGVECCNLITECEHGKLHIVPDVGIVEIVRKDGTDCLPGETGEIISTGLLNFDQPLIRYKICDFVKLSLNQTCKCGRNMPIVDEIVGRIEDTIIGADGREITRFHGVFIGIPSIIEGQVIQNSLNNFQINIAVSKPLESKEVELIKKRMVSQLGDADINISYLDMIPRASNGKFKAVISKVARNL